MNYLLALVPGILTDPVAASWPDRLDAWWFARDPRCKVIKKEYVAGPFPRWNCFLKDPLLARSLANELLLFLDRTGVPPVLDGNQSLDEPASKNDGQDTRPAVWLVAHSNGALIALLTARRLIAAGQRVTGLALLGAACEADLVRNGVRAWLDAGQLGAAIAYCSADDAVLPAPILLPPNPPPGCRGPLRNLALRTLYSVLARPYGSLGRTGWLEHGQPVPASSAPDARVRTRWFAGGHSAYFQPVHLERTFECLYQDITSTPSPYVR